MKEAKAKLVICPGWNLRTKECCRPTRHDVPHVFDEGICIGHCPNIDIVVNPTCSEKHLFEYYVGREVKWKPRR